MTSHSSSSLPDALKRVFRQITSPCYSRVKIGGADYRLTFMSGILRSERPVLVQICEAYLQLFEPAGPLVKDGLAGMIDKANQTLLTQIADFNGYVVIVAPKTTAIDAQAFYDLRITSAPDAVKKFFDTLHNRPVLNGPGARAAAPGA